jgi:MFS family permease
MRILKGLEGKRIKKLLYISTIFLSAFLLFQVQPMIAKMILPWFGGAAAVWITAMLFFQTVLLFGYLYAHWSIRRLNHKMQFVVHTFLLGASLLLLPLTPALSWKPAGSEEPIARILGLLTVSVGLPYFLLSTTSPLLQAWYARNFQTAVPYRLFGLSNLSSLLGLIAYPFLIEPAFTLRQQSGGWSVGFAVFVILCLIVAVVSSGNEATKVVAPQDMKKMDRSALRPPRIREQIIWLLLSCCSSSLLLAVTNHLTQNVASVPFLWILPLSLYLLTFVICFDYEQFYNRKIFSWLLMFALAGMTYGLTTWGSQTSLKLIIPAFSVGLFICCMFCHGEIVQRKPAPRYLTSFYLMLSVGGALGALLVGLIAPRVLNGFFELDLALVACAVLLLFLLPHQQWKAAATGSFVVVLFVTALAYSNITAFEKAPRVMGRNFYGVLRVLESDIGTERESRVLVHGSINHGKQFVAPDRRRDHTAYFGPESGVGLAISALRRSPIKVGVIGLGAGILASYAEPGDFFRFYEINPLVETIAKDQFTYLSDALGKVDVVIGDGRLSLEREVNQHYDLLVVDAFSGDSIPVHLLTQQALELYFRHLKTKGILAIHTSNRYLNIAPVVEQLSRSLDKYAVSVENPDNENRGIYQSQWALVTSAPLRASYILRVAKKIPVNTNLRIWTDDYSNLFQILR